MSNPDRAEQIRREHLRNQRKYHELNQFAVKHQTVMVGSSLMEWFPINELMMSAGIPDIVYNRGLGGYTTDDLLQCMDECIFELEPRRIFINIGTNDLGLPGDDIGHLIANYRTILTQIQQRLPECQINVMAYYPVADLPLPENPPGGRKPRTLAAVHEANRRVKLLAEELGLRYLDFNRAIADERGYLRTEYAADPIHMWPSAYQSILKLLLPYLLEP